MEARGQLSEGLTLHETEPDLAALTLLRRFPGCLMRGQGRECGQAQGGGPVNDSSWWIPNGHSSLSLSP